MSFDFIDGIPLAVGDRFFDGRRLLSAGITHVLSTLISSERGPHLKTGLEHFDPDYGNCVGEFLNGEVEFARNSFRDTGEDPGKEYWWYTMDYGTRVLSIPSNRLLVHCAVGRNRAPANVYAILRALGRSEDEAWHLLSTARPKSDRLYIPFIDAALSQRTMAIR